VSHHYVNEGIAPIEAAAIAELGVVCAPSRM
jgi:hypothetical protein